MEMTPTPLDNGWLPIESAPKDMTPIWLAYKNSYGKNRFAHAQYIPRYTEENDTDYAEYCEDKDEYYTPEGWYEICANWDDCSAMKICGAEFIGWMPLPAFPAEHTSTCPACSPKRGVIQGDVAIQCPACGKPMGAILAERAKENPNA